jgi:hypothetical protein
MRFKIINLFKNDWDAVFANDNTFHFNATNLRVPFMGSYV